MASHRTTTFFVFKESLTKIEHNSTRSTTLGGLLFLFVMIIFLAAPSLTQAANYDASPADFDTALVLDEDDRNVCSGVNCVPLVLIHGIHGNQKTDHSDRTVWPSDLNRDYFLNLLNYIYSSGIASKYRIYRFHYVSDKHSVGDIGKSLANKIDDYTSLGIFPNRDFVIVAHSMGGLVARSYMSEWELSGKRVLKLITLATPHHGSPAANDSTRISFLLDPLWALTLEIIDRFAWKRVSPNITIVESSQPNRSDLRFDNYNGIWSTDIYTSPNEKNEWLITLNENSSLDDKIIAYYGYIRNDDVLLQYLNTLNPNELMAWYSDEGTRNYVGTVLGIGRLLSCSDGKNCHEDLRAASAVMSRFYFLSNDGVVPIDSARFNKHQLLKTYLWDGYDHSDMKDGKSISGTIPLFDKIKEDLLAIYDTAAPIISASLTISPQSSSYSVGQTISGKFVITNKGTTPITVAKLTIGGRDPDGQVADFPAKICATLQPNVGYKYESAIKLTKAGLYHFFPAYETPIKEPACPVPDEDWNTAIPVESGLTKYTLDSPLNIPVVLDGSSPAVSITAPDNGSTITGTVAVTASASDNSGTVSKVEFYLDNIRRFTHSSSPSFTWSWNTTTASNGSHVIKVIAYDAANNSSVPASIIVTVNNSIGGNNVPNAPTALYQYKSDGVTSMAAGDTTNERTVIMKGDVSDVDNDMVLLEVEIKPLGSAFSGNPSSNCSSGGFVSSGSIAKVTCTGLADGQYHWQARAKDSKGDYSGWYSAGGNSEDSADIIVSAGTQMINYPPSVTVITPNGGETLTIGTPFDIKWSAIDNTGTIQEINIYESTDGGVSWYSPIQSNLSNTGLFTWTPSHLGTKVRIKVEAIDSYGSPGWGISYNDFTVSNIANDLTAPTLQAVSVTGSSYTITWSNVGSVISYILQEDSISNSFLNTTTIYSGPARSWTDIGKAPGTYYYRVKAVEGYRSSNWSNAQSVTVQANQGPGNITALSPADGASNQPLDVTLSWNGTHSGGENLRYNVYVCYAYTDFYFTNNIKASGQTLTSFDLKNLPYNTDISWGIEAIDDSGDTRFSEIFHFRTIQDSSSPIGTLMINNGAASTVSYSVTLNLTATDSDSGIQYMSFSNDGVHWDNWYYFSTQFLWNLADDRYGGLTGKASYTVYAKFRDAQGNESVVYSAAIAKTAGKPGQVILNGALYETIKDAVNAANSGDTIYLTEGVFTIAAEVNPPRYPSRVVGIVMKPGVTLKGAGAEKTTLLTEGATTPLFTVIDADNAVIEGLTIINQNGGWARYSVLLESVSSKIKNCIIKGSFEGILVGFSTPASKAEISNNLIVNNGTGIRVDSTSSETVIRNNTISDNNTSGIANSSSTTTIINNIIANSGGGCGISIGGTAPSISYNDLFNTCNYQGLGNQTGINGNISSSPSFADSSAGNYQLGSSSPCINAGTDVGIPFSGSAPDIGAFEYAGVGVIQVTSNRSDASFTVQGPNGYTFTGTEMNWLSANLPIGIYTITFSSVPNYYSPPYQSMMLYSGQTLAFDSTYKIDTVVPSGKVMLNYGEYATSKERVIVILDVDDKVAGMGSGAQMMFSNDGQTWSAAEPFASIKKDWNLTGYGGNGNSGTKTVYAKVSDALGNWATLTAAVLYVPNRRIIEVPIQYSAIQMAIEAAEEGDIVYVLPGDYTVLNDITVKKGVRLQGAGSLQTKMHGSNSSINIYMLKNSMIDGFDGNFYLYVDNIGSGPAIISNNVIRRRLDIYDAGIGTEAIVRNNLFFGGQIRVGGHSSDNKAHVDIESNTLVNQPDSGLSLAAAIYVSGTLPECHISLKNNIIANNPIGVMETNTNDGVHQHIFPLFNTYWNNIRGNFGEIGSTDSNVNYFKLLGPGDVNANPMFVDTGHEDYNLQATSPSLHSGSPDVRYNNPDGTRNTRGAYGGPCVNTPPTADFATNSLQGNTNVGFVFDARLSHDRESQDDNLLVRWDLDGDGVFDTDFSANKPAMHRFNTAGVYTVSMQVKDEGGFISTYSKNITILNIPPNVPANPTPTDKSISQPATVILRWDGGSNDFNNTVKYDVYFGATADPPLISLNQSDAYFNPGILNYDRVYYWRIVSRDANGTESLGQLWSFVVRGSQTPAMPTGLSSEILSTSNVKLTWFYSDADILGFILERKAGENGTYSLITTQSSDITSYIDEGLFPYQPYFYRIKAFSIYGDSNYSDETSILLQGDKGDINGDLSVNIVDAILALQVSASIHITMPVYKQADVNGDQKIGMAEAIYAVQKIANIRVDNGSATPPSTPAGFVVVANSSSQIDLSWDASGGTVTGYKVYKDGAYLKSLAATSTTDTGLSPSTNYCYMVSAFNLAGESLRTNQICASTQAATPVYSNASLSGVWLTSQIGDYWPAYLVADGNDTITDASGINLANPAGTYRVNSDGSYVGSFNYEGGTSGSFSGSLDSQNSGTITIGTFPSALMHKVDDLSAFQGNYSGMISKDGTSYNISLRVSSTGFISNFVSNIPGVTSASGRAYAIDSSAALMIRTNLTSAYGQIFAGGTLANGQFSASFMNGSGPSTGTVSLINYPLDGQWLFTQNYTYDCSPLSTKTGNIIITKQDATHFTFPVTLSDPPVQANGAGTISGNNVTFAIEVSEYPQGTGPVYTGTINDSFTSMSGTFTNGPANTWCSFGGTWTATKDTTP